MKKGLIIVLVILGIIFVALTMVPVEHTVVDKTFELEFGDYYYYGVSFKKEVPLHIELKVLEGESGVYFVVMDAENFDKFKKGDPTCEIYEDPSTDEAVKEYTTDWTAPAEDIYFVVLNLSFETQKVHLKITASYPILPIFVAIPLDRMELCYT